MGPRAHFKYTYNSQPTFGTQFLPIMHQIVLSEYAFRDHADLKYSNNFYKIRLTVAQCLQYAHDNRQRRILGVRYGKPDY